METERLERLKKIIAVKLNNFKDIPVTPEQIELGIAEMEQVIKNYCNIFAVPVELDYTLCNMVVDLIRYYNTIWKEDSGEFIFKGITNLKVGRAEVSQGASVQTKTDLHKTGLDDIILNYAEQLAGFRRLVW